MTAARVAATFGQSPLAVLRSEAFEWAVWVAAAKIIESDRGE